MNTPRGGFQPGGGGVSGTALVVGVVIMFSITTASSVVLAIWAPEGTTVIAVLFANLAAALPAVLALAKVTNTAEQVDKLANGLMDAKVRSGMADVIDDRFIDPDALPVLAADRQRLAVERARERKLRQQQGRGQQ